MGSQLYSEDSRKASDVSSGAYGQLFQSVKRTSAVVSRSATHIFRLTIDEEVTMAYFQTKFISVSLGSGLKRWIRALAHLFPSFSKAIRKVLSDVNESNM
jgi:hypothetical protein